VLSARARTGLVNNLSTAGFPATAPAPLGQSRQSAVHTQLAGECLAGSKPDRWCQGWIGRSPRDAGQHRRLLQQNGLTWLALAPWQEACARGGIAL